MRLAVLLLLSAPAPVLATTPAEVARIACEGIAADGAETAITLEDFAEAVIVAMGGRPSVERARAGTLVDAVLSPDQFAARDYARPVMAMRDAFAANPQATARALKLRFSPAVPAGAPWRWFHDNRAAIEVICLPRRTPPARPARAFLDSFDRATPVPRWNLARSVGDLAATDKQGRKTGRPAEIGFTRSREFTDSGSRTTRKAQVQATAGYRISADRVADPSFVYVSYVLGQARVSPAPVLPAGRRARDSDLESVELGLASSAVSLGDAGAMVVTGAFTAGLVDDSSRLTGRVAVRPAFILPLGLCNFGTYARFAGLRSGCHVELAADGATVTRRGRADPGRFDHYLAVGAALGWTVRPDLSPQGLIVDLSWSWLPVIAGPVRDFERLDAALGYRWWIDNRYAIDLGPAYRRGTEVQTLKREDVLTLRFGLLF